MNYKSIIEELSLISGQFEAAIKNLENLGPLQPGMSPKTEVFSEHKTKLYHYHETRGVTERIPLVIAFALVNRPYVIDLQPSRSLVKSLLDRGLDVYLIDWGYPDKNDQHLNLDDYINRHLHHCIEYICDSHDTASVNLLGICQGGCLSLCYNAIHPERIHRLVTMVTPVDFHTRDNLLFRLVRNIDIDRVVATFGNIPGAYLNAVFQSLKPYELSVSKYLTAAELIADKEKIRTFLLMEQWINDSPDQAGAAFREFVTDFFQKNALVKNRLIIGGKAVRLGRINNPVLNIFASRDHLVPPSSSQALSSLIPEPCYSELEIQGGHIGIYVSPSAGQQIPEAIDRHLR